MTATAELLPTNRSYTVCPYADLQPGMLVHVINVGQHRNFRPTYIRGRVTAVQHSSPYEVRSVDVRETRAMGKGARYFLTQPESYGVYTFYRETDPPTAIGPGDQVTIGNGGGRHIVTGIGPTGNTTTMSSTGSRSSRYTIDQMRHA